jgi:ribose transport system substrate-binding protein
VTALREADLLGKVKIVGFDASPVMVSYLKAGSIQSIAAQQAQQIGVDGIDQAVKALEGKPTTKKIDLPAVTITKATLNSAAAKATLQSLKCNGA